MKNQKEVQVATHWKDRDLIEGVVQTSSTKSEALRALGLTCSMGNYQTLERWVKKHCLSTDHFTPNVSRVDNGRSTKQSRDRLWTLEDACVVGSLCGRGIVKRLVIKHRAIPYECRCGITGEWRGAPITLHIEHKNGVRDDHRLENLEFLCPNCHSQTTTYAGRNKPPSNKIKKSIGTKRQGELERKDATSTRIKDLASTIPNDMFVGWGAKKRVADFMNIPPGVLMRYFREYAPEFLDKFTR